MLACVAVVAVALIAGCGSSKSSVGVLGVQQAEQATVRIIINKEIDMADMQSGQGDVIVSRQENMFDIVGGCTALCLS